MDNTLVLASQKATMSTSQASPIVTRNSPSQRNQPSMKIEDALKIPVETIRAQALDAMGRLSMMSPRLGGLLLLAVKLYPQMSPSNQAKVTYLASRAKHSGMLDGCPCGGSLAGQDDGSWEEDDYYDEYDDYEGQNQSGAAGQSTNVQKTNTASGGTGLNSIITSFLNAGANVATSAIQQQAAADVAAKKAAIDAAKQQTAASIQKSAAAASTSSATKKPTKKTAPSGFFAKHWGKVLVGTIVVTAGGVGTAWYMKKKKEDK